MATPHLGLIGFSGLNLAYSLVLTIFRHSVYEIDNYPVSLTENALSGACFGAVYYLLNKNSQSVSSCEILMSQTDFFFPLL
jgi:hypothetical protein